MNTLSVIPHAVTLTVTENIELVVKWDCAPRDNSQAGLTGNVYH